MELVERGQREVQEEPVESVVRVVLALREELEDQEALVLLDQLVQRDSMGSTDSLVSLARLEAPAVQEPQAAPVVRDR